MRNRQLPLCRSAALLIAGLIAATSPASAVNLLTATPSTISLTCSTVTGPGPAATVVVKPITALTGSNTHVVTFGSVGAGLVVTAPAVTTLSLSNQVAGISYTVRMAAGCSGASTGSATFQFSTGAGTDVTVTVNRTVTVGTSSPLVPTPSAILLTCTRTPGSPATYTPGAAATLAVKSATTGGTPFTVDNGSYAPPSWLTVSPMGGGTASTTAVNLTLTPAAGCGGFAAGTTNTTTIRLVSSPAPDKQVQVTLQVVAPSPLVATPNGGVLSYTKNSGTPSRLDVVISSASVPPPFISVDAATLPTWLTVDTLVGSTPKSLRFTTTPAADSMVPGSYSSVVKVRVSNYADLSIPVTLQLNNPAPKLTVSEGLTRNISWVVGTPLPTAFITAVSSDSPIPYTIDTGGPLAPIVASANLKGLAYSFGTPIPVTFSPTVFASAQPGTVMVGTVALTWGNPATALTVTFNVTVQAASATITAITPASLPTAPGGQSFTLVLSGSGFVSSNDPAYRTKVGIISGSAFIVDPNISVNVVNVSSIILTVTAPLVASTTLPFSPTGAGGTVTLGVCNPAGTNCTTPTGTTFFTIGSNPIVQAVTSASSYQQVSGTDVQKVAPYDMISIFGANFCSSGGRGCSSSDVLYGIPNPVTLAYPTFLTPDAPGATQRKLTVTFQTRATPPVVIATAPLLFATNGQINVMAPAALEASIGNTVDMVVNFGYGSGATMLSSAPYPLSVLVANPGIFTVAANGMGDGAILNSTYNLVVAGLEAGMRSTATDSDTVQIYMTGLGSPNSTADNATAGSAFTWSSDCITPASYLTALDLFTGVLPATADGLIMSSALVNSNRLMPCFVSGGAKEPTVTIGGVAGVVSYAGWVANSIAGLYQVNVRLPGSSAGPFTKLDGTTISTITTPVQLPVVVTSGSVSSQNGVSVWVARKLKIAPPSGAGLTGLVGVAWSSSNNSVVATQGTAPYQYAVTSGLLPAGLTLNASTGAISGIPAANTSGTYQVTVTATDSANFPISGSTSFTVTVGGGLFMTATGTSPFAETFGTADATVTTVTATSGTFPYAYSLTGPSPLPAGLTINSTTGVVSVSSSLPAGTYNVTVTATDSSATPLTGTANFSIVVGLLVARTNPVAGANGVASTISTVSATGNTGAVTYTLDAASAALGWLTINASTGVVAITNAAPAATTQAVTVTATSASSATGASAVGTGTVAFTVTIN